MEQKAELKIIAHIHTDFPEKFGVPRQSGLVKELTGRIVFVPEYRNPDALRGIEGYDYLWLLWKFEGVEREKWSPTVRPPRLGGETHMGVFATRSPFRPNPIGLSSVKLERLEQGAEGPVLVVSGIDLRDNTPIYDIKPYLPYVDSHPQARGGFAEEKADYALKVEFPESLLEKIPKQKRKAIIEVLKQDPRPAYHDDQKRKYGVAFAGFDIRFCVAEGVLTVFEVVERI
ncbi:MAG: tRNA (N6-threonylcarbamoyladenosine(37)-N6)-methyltransferase TrmO [Roseburia sp.]|nr:tRNA (N6-threonylcarbamoyladenosine(37)-N6)-methyltransferase TrmO [Roseburia sp.]